MTETVLRNLITNAIKFTKPNGTIIVSSERDDNWIKIKVADNGVGISEENIQKLFRIDSNYSTKGTAEESGTGLGLILCKELVEKQGGKIYVTSKKDSGSTFSFTLPAAN
jgi:signal transduction histidine kinase